MARLSKAISRKTRKKSSSKNTIVVFLLEMINTIKMYHWQTFSYPQHKATDELYDTMNGHIDRFIEVLLGKTGSRFTLPKSFTLNIDNYSGKENVIKKMNYYKNVLMNISQLLGSQMLNTDLLNIRDEMVGDINQFLYLLTLK